MKKIISLFLLISITLFAQEPLITDRPDITESAITIPENSFQLETGFIIQNSRGEEANAIINIKDISVLGTLLRYGLFRDLELRLGAEYLYQRINSAQTQELEGLSGIMVGAKYQITKDYLSLPDLALLAHLNLPAGSENFSPEKIEPELILSAANSLTQNFSISFNLGGSWNSSDERVGYLYSVSIGGSLSDKLGTFIEFFGEAENEISPGNGVDGGFTYLLADNFQADLSAGIFLNEPKDNWFISTGVSFRLPE